VPFTYNVNSAGNQEPITGAFEVDGAVNGNSNITTALIDAIEHALFKSQQCKTTKGQKCVVKKKRSPDSGPEAFDCIDETLYVHQALPYLASTGPSSATADPECVCRNDCTYVNFIEATLFGSDSAFEAQITMKATSGAQGGFDCDTVFGILGAGTTVFDADPVVQGGVSIGNIICNALTGS